MIPLNQLIPECLLALGGAFLLGNLAAYIRLRPAWREAKEGGGGQDAKEGRGGQAAGPAAKRGRGGRAPQPAAKESSSGGQVAGRVSKERGGDQVAGRAARATIGARAKVGRPGTGGTTPGRTGSGNGGRGQARSGGAKAAAGPRGGSSGRVNARVREPTASGSKLPSRTRVLTNVLIGLLISVAALAALIRG